MRRWVFRIFISFAALIVASVAAVQVILWTNLPRNLVIRQIEQELGLRISAESLSTGWLGRTTLTHVSMGLPLSEKSFLSVETLRVKHNTLLGLLFGRAISIDSIELDGPNLVVAQNAQGEWNLGQVAELLAQASGGNSATQSAQEQGVPKLPRLELKGGSIEVVSNGNQRAMLTPVSVNGYSDGPLVWKYDVKIGQDVSIVGEVAPGGTWQHRINLVAHHLDGLMKSAGSHDADLAATWRGKIDGNKLIGLISLDHATATDIPGAGDVKAKGEVNVESDGATITVRPEQIDVNMTSSTLREIRISSGAISSDSSGIHAQSVQVGMLGGAAIVDASFNPNTEAADLTAQWAGLELTNKITHEGSLKASVRVPFDNRPTVTLNLQSRGKTSGGEWDTVFNLTGQGQSWQDMDWLLTAPTMTWKGKNPIQLAQLVGHIRQRLPDIELTDLTVPARPHLVSQGSIDVSSGQWNFWLDAGSSVPSSGESAPVSVWLNAWGDKNLYTLKEMYVQLADATIWAGGFYDRKVPKPVNLDIVLSQTEQGEIDSPIQGHARGNFNVSGLLFDETGGTFHPHLEMRGNLISNDLSILKHPIGDVDMKLTGERYGNDTRLSTTQFNLFQGNWNVEYHNAGDEHGASLDAAVTNMPLAQLAKVAGAKEITGEVDNADWHFQIPAIDPNRIGMRSQMQVSNLTIGEMKIDRVHASAELRTGQWSVPIEASASTGKAEVTLGGNLNNPGLLQTDLTVDQWPWALPGGGTLTLSTKKGTFAIDLQHRGAVGSMATSADLKFGDRELAHGDLVAKLQGRVVAVSNLSGKILNGNFAGSALVDIDAPEKATGQLAWSKVDASALAPISPALSGLGGNYSGDIVFDPAEEEHPYAPLRIDAAIWAAGGHYKTIRFGAGSGPALKAVAYAGDGRVVLQSCQVGVAGGTIDLWARISQQMQSQAAVIDFTNLQLDQIARALPNEKEELPGLLTGRFDFIGAGADLSKLVGSGKVELTQSDLAHWGPIAAVYDAMHIGGGRSLTGFGRMSLAYEQYALRVTDFDYFNKGIEARGLFNLGPDIRKGLDAPVGGQIVGLARPLKNIRLPLLGDFDEVFTALQSDLTPIDVVGTLGHPKYLPANVQLLSSDLKELLVGNARSENGG